MDQRVGEYGPPADPACALLHAYTAAALYSTRLEEGRPSGRFPEPGPATSPDNLESRQLGAMLLQVNQMIAGLTPENAVQRQLIPMLAARKQTTLEDRWVLVGSAQSTLSWLFMFVTIFWLVLVFAIFGLSAPANVAVYAVIGLAALSLSPAIWLIKDCDAPLKGLLKVSSAAMREALAHMDLPAVGPPS